MSRQNPTVIIALGGNAISPKNETGNIDLKKHLSKSYNAVAQEESIDAYRNEYSQPYLDSLINSFIS